MSEELCQITTSEALDISKGLSDAERGFAASVSSGQGLSTNN